VDSAALVKTLRVSNRAWKTLRVYHTTHNPGCWFFNDEKKDKENESGGEDRAAKISRCADGPRICVWVCKKGALISKAEYNFAEENSARPRRA